MSLDILSLFDGISCGQIALERARIPIRYYYASEIDNNAIKITQHNYPKTIQLGDVATIKANDLYKVDLLMGGSPCQGFSTAGKQLNFQDPRSRLFYQFVRLQQELQPRYFFLENVIMKKEYEEIISANLGVKPIKINSCLLSAQNRQRLYWTNIPNITQPNDKKIRLDDVIDVVQNPKLIRSWKRYVPPELPKYCDPYNKKTITHKSTTLRLNVSNGNMWVKCDGGYRNLTVTECERLQTIPDGYTNVEGISDSCKKKAIANGWTVDVIAHIFHNLQN